MTKKLLFALRLCIISVVFLALVTSCTAKSASPQANAEDAVSSASHVKSYAVKNMGNAQAKTFEYETDVFKIIFDTKGASISSMMLKNHADADGTFVDLVFNGDSNQNAFLMYWGDGETPVNDAFDYKEEENKVIFTNDFADEKGQIFTVVKTFEFRKSDYLIKVSVDIKGNGPETGDYAYTLSFAPQIGPEFKTINSGKGKAYGDYRRFYGGLVKNNGKVKRTVINLAKDGTFFTTRRLSWISLTSKYFTVVARPVSEDVAYKYQAYQGAGTNPSQINSIYISVPVNNKESNSVYFYCGPQLKKYLGSYYSGTDNEWGLRKLNLDDAMESGSFLGWLETLLKWCLIVLNKIVPNYGIDIIILTIILKFALWPLQRKSTESTAKMSTVTPAVNEIKAKYPNNPQKQNEEMQKLYKEKGINPMGGCLPLLIQFPILIAFYGLLNRHFELRGAMFIPGWIPDLSVPETIATLGFSLPLLGSQIHLLPILYTASMIFSMKYTQASNQNATTNNSMWFMTWGMPIMFFFILYSAPSGLLLYWFTQNILSIIQQKYTNDKIKKFGPDVFSKKKNNEGKKEPKAVLMYQEKLKKLAEAKNNEKKV